MPTIQFLQRSLKEVAQEALEFETEAASLRELNDELVSFLKSTVSGLVSSISEDCFKRSLFTQLFLQRNNGVPTLSQQTIDELSSGHAQLAINFSDSLKAIVSKLKLFSQRELDDGLQHMLDDLGRQLDTILTRRRFILDPAYYTHNVKMPVSLATARRNAKKSGDFVDEAMTNRELNALMPHDSEVIRTVLGASHGASRSPAMRNGSDEVHSAQTVADMEVHLRDLQYTIDNLRATVDALTRENGELRGHLSKYDAVSPTDIALLQADYARLRAENHRLAGAAGLVEAAESWVAVGTSTDEIKFRYTAVQTLDPLPDAASDDTARSLRVLQEELDMSHRDRRELMERCKGLEDRLHRLTLAGQGDSRVRFAGASGRDLTTDALGTPPPKGDVSSLVASHESLLALIAKFDDVRASRLIRSSLTGDSYVGDTLTADSSLRSVSNGISSATRRVETIFDSLMHDLGELSRQLDTRDETLARLNAELIEGTDTLNHLRDANKHLEAELKSANTQVEKQLSESLDLSRLPPPAAIVDPAVVEELQSKVSAYEAKLEDGIVVKRADVEKVLALLRSKTPMSEFGMDEITDKVGKILHQYSELKEQIDGVHGKQQRLSLMLEQIEDSAKELTAMAH